MSLANNSQNFEKQYPVLYQQTDGMSERTMATNNINLTTQGINHQDMTRRTILSSLRGSQDSSGSHSRERAAALGHLLSAKQSVSSQRPGGVQMQNMRGVGHEMQSKLMTSFGQQNSSKHQSKEPSPQKPSQSHSIGSVVQMNNVNRT